MNNNPTAEMINLGTRTHRMVGRKEEIERLNQCLHARGDRHFVYYWATGGLGKTRLLEELERLVAKAGPGYYSTGIIDLYHTDTHSSSDVERAIVNSLDPEAKYFANYRQDRDRFERLRERGADPVVLERHREELSQTFIKDCREMAIDARKLVLIFDTVELLQYESFVVEEQAGAGTVDTRIRTWLLDKLAELANVLIVFAGRPKARSHEEKVDHQLRLVRDMEMAFGQDLTVVEIKPLTLAETGDFIKVLTRGQEIIPAEYLPIVHRLTGGRPIFLHLVVDLVQELALELSRVIALFDQYKDLVEAPEDDPRLTEAVDDIEINILRALLNEGGELGEYLHRLALMPKGVDAEILQQVLGLPLEEAEQLLTKLSPLSFVKRFRPSPGAQRLHTGRVFLHDEMYQLLTKPKVMPRLRINERAVAHAIISNYYDPHIGQLEEEIERTSLEERIPLRERLQKLQVERLFYLLVQDPGQGYGEYKRLSNQANRHRWVGFSMRLLDEFLRFYNTPERRKLFESANIPQAQIIRESAQMWVERFHWWGQRERAIGFARHILDQPELFAIEPRLHPATLANICALWTSNRAVLHGYEPAVMEEAQAALDRLPPLAECQPEEILARARLATAIGYQYRLGGLLDKASAEYVEAKGAFQALPDNSDELAMLLNNLAYVYARQGRMILARPLAHEALQINEMIGSEYPTGLTLSTIATIERLQGNYARAIEYGEEALEKFRTLEDAHGITLAHLALAYANRRMAKYDTRQRRKLEEAYRKLEETRETVSKALEGTEEMGFVSDTTLLLAEQGRVFRDLGNIASFLEGAEKGLSYYRRGENYLKRALAAPELSAVDRVDTLEDLAEVLFLSGDQEAAEQVLSEVETQIGPEYQIVPGQAMPSRELANEYFAPLGKVEMLRGQMALAHKQYEQGLKHYVLAYAYFMCFSPDAVEKETMVEYLYHNLRAVETRRELVQSIRNWVKQFDPALRVELFIEILESLLGV